MSEVKRYMQYRGKMAEREGGKYILASDFDAREAKWKEVVRELVDCINDTSKCCGEGICDICTQLQHEMITKANALLNDQPQED